MKMLKKFFAGNNKYFSLSVLLFLLILIIGFYEPAKINELRRKGRAVLEEENEKIASLTEKRLEEIQKEFLSRFFVVESKISSFLSKGSENIPKIKETASVVVWKDSTLLFWQNPKTERKDFLRNFNPQEVFFEKNDLTTELAVYDTLRLGTESFLIKYSETIKKYYKFENDYFIPLDLERRLSEKCGVEVKIAFSPSAVASPDGRFFSAPLYNNFGNKIGELYFQKISFEAIVKNRKEKIAVVQNTIALLIFLLFAIGFYKEIRVTSKPILEILTLTILVIVFRYALYFLNIPRVYLSGEIIEPKYFSSNFAFGITSSPLELTVTVVIFTLLTFYYLWEFKKSLRKETAWKRSSKYLFVFLGGMLSPLILRGFAASVQSFIFESSLRYFELSTIVPDFMTSLMLANLLFLAVAFANVYLIFFFFVRRLAPDLKEGIRLVLVFLFSFSVFAFIFGHRLLPFWLMILVLIAMAFISFVIYSRKEARAWNYFFLTLFASLFSLIVLLNFNGKLRQESIKTLAREITRPKENLYRFYLNRVLSDEDVKETLKEFSEGELSASATAFRVWTNTPFQKEDASLLVQVVEKKSGILGEFNYKYPLQAEVDFQFGNVGDFAVQKIRPKVPGNFLRGIKRIDKNKYLIVDVAWNIPEKLKTRVPKFIETKRILNKIRVESGDWFALKIFSDSVRFVYGKPNLSRRQILLLSNASFSEWGDAWREMKVGNDNYQIYLLKTSKRESEIEVVGLKIKGIEFTWFYFIRLFFFHSLLIFFAFFVLFVVGVIKRRRFGITFRLRLTVAFVLVAVLPLIFLVFYVRFVTENKNSNAISFKLNKRLSGVELFLKNQIYSYDDFQSFFNAAYENTKTNYSVFYSKRLAYTTYSQYYDCGLFPKWLDYKVAKGLLEKENDKILLGNKIEKYSYHAAFAETLLDDKPFIIEVNDAFNPMRLPMSSAEFDVFLFGTYALALIFTLLLASLLANQISTPIRKLTRATKSVGHGDLDVSIKNTFRGEMGELVEGFNFMVKELKKHQRELSAMERELAWREMARQVAHEIKNPLTPMKLSVQHLLATYKDNSPKFAEVLERVGKTLIEQIEILKNIASEFGNVAKMPKPKLEKVNLVESLNLTKNLFEEENISVRILNAEKEHFVFADGDNLRRIFINLIRNSLQARASEIVFEVKESDDSIILRVWDNGHGIPEEYRDKIFEPNFTTKKEGMGLGLIMAKSYLESIGAEISLGEPSEGAEFILKFPKEKQ